jgi:hypothetical protein
MMSALFMNVSAVIANPLRVRVIVSERDTLQERTVMNNMSHAG